MDIPKSKSSIWEVRNRNVDLGMSQIKFGIKVDLGYNIPNDKKVIGVQYMFCAS